MRSVTCWFGFQQSRVSVPGFFHKKDEHRVRALTQNVTNNDDGVKVCELRSKKITFACAQKIFLFMSGLAGILTDAISPFS